MADVLPDEVFAQHLLKAGFVTEAELRVALQAQAESAEKGSPVLLGDVLVQQGIFTPAQRQKAEKRIEVQRDEAKRLGQYRLLKKLGEGGFGMVYLAEAPESGQKVALKVLPKVAAQDEENVRRFLREVDSAQKLEHPNIVRAGASGEDKGLHYYVMEYVEGETLGKRLKREHALACTDATKFILQVAQGLKYAHEQGFIHRDIKPDNVIVSKEGVVKILDMGLSKNIEEAQTFRTVTGIALGTPHYIAPEQARGDKGIDGRADIYSLGATYYHLVTGETPFHGATPIEIITKHINKQLPDPRDIRDGIPDGVVHIIRRMMAKKPGDRYRNCEELVTDLELVLGGRNPSTEALEAARSTVALPMAREARERFRAQRQGMYRPVTKPKANPVLMIAGSVTAVVILVIVLAVAMGGGSPSPAAVVVTKKEPETETPKSQIPEKQILPAKTREELRSEEAQRNLDEIKAAQKRSLEEEEILHRYAEFAKEYGDTAQGKTIADWLKSKEPKRPVEPPKVAEPVKIVETPKQEEPSSPPVAKPEPKPVERAPAQPVVKPAPEPPKRQAVPDAAKQREAETAVRKAFPIDQAKSPKEKTELARTLLTTALTSGAKDAELYVMLRQARILAVQGMGVKTALEAIDALAAAFDVDAMADKLDLFTKTTVKGPDASAWATEALEVAQAASEANDYETAVKLATRAEILARAANDKNLLDMVNEQSKDLADLKRVANGLKAHFKTLETKPDDPVANAEVGKFLSFVKGDWKRGLPMLAKGSDSALKTLADQELANPNEAAAQAALGEAWAAQAEKETQIYKPRAKARAAEWLGRAIPGLTGLAKITAEKKLASLGPVGLSKNPLALDLGGGAKIELVYIKPGIFTMGSSEAPTAGWQKDDRPEHKVTITKGYYLGKFEVTRGQFAAFVKATGYKTDAEREGHGGSFMNGRWNEKTAGTNWQNPKPFTQTDDHPVVCISWNDAKAFCDWASKRTGRGVRLPTEAEWEYACRAGTKTKWSFGDTESAIDEYAWHENNSGLQTHPVGQKKPNAWGLYDMLGNAMECCQDWWGPYGGDATDPKGPSTGNEWSQRGGGWITGPKWCNVTLRISNPLSNRWTSFGFRVCVP